MNQKGIVLSGLIYALLVFFLLLLASLLTVLWYRQSALNSLKDDANNIYDETYIPTFTVDFDYTGSYQTFTIPVTGSYQIELWGAQGRGGTAGGKGAYTIGTVTLIADQAIYVYVGQYRSDLSNVTSFNGGTGTSGGYPGGGATDIRLISGNWNDNNSLKTRIMVAAGGGSGSNISVDKGYGGGLTGGPGGTTATGGTQVAGGTRDSVSWPEAGFGYGGGGCGGGGGYYGGGGAACVNGAGGGSSFISGFAGCNAINPVGIFTGQPNHYSGKVFINASMIAGNATMPSPSGDTETGHSNNGYARIKYLP